MPSSSKTNPVMALESHDLHSSSEEQRDLSGSAGQVIAGRYELEVLLGKGGMGEVWRARHVVTERSVAVKLLRRTLAYNPDMRRRFLRESRMAAAVDHPNVVEVLDAFEAEDGSLALVMPLLQGETFRNLLQRSGPLDLDTTLHVLLPLISAVSAAHERGIVHRDLKPDNVFLANEHGEQVVKVLDFGVAKLLEVDAAQGTLTGTGAVLGTPGYMAPEQALAEHDQDHGVDIWALGVIAYEALSGCKPVEGENSAQLIRSLLTQAITPLHILVPDVPQPIAKVVMSMLQRDRANRPRDLAEVASVLREYLPGYVSPRVEIRSSRPRFSAPEVRRSEPPTPPTLRHSPSVSSTAGTTLASPSDKPPGQASTSGSRGRPLAIVAGVGLVAAAYWWLRPGVEPEPREAQPSASVLPMNAPQITAAPAETEPTVRAPLPASAAPSSAGASSSRPKPPTTKPSKLAPSASPTASVAPSSAPRARQPDGLQEEPPF